MARPAAIRPRPLRSGDLIAIAAPADPVSERRLQATSEWCEAAGFRVRISPEVTVNRDYTRRDDEFRARSLAQLAADPEVRAIITARGGYGTARLLRFLDPTPFWLNAPIVMGYSDVALLLAWLHARADLVTFHGPVAWSLKIGMDVETERSVLWALTRAEPWGVMGDGYSVALVPGRASGTLVGGNLTMIAQTLGTPYQIDTRDAVLFLEDTSGYEDTEEDIELALLHLKAAGLLDAATGFVVGDLSDDEDYSKSLVNTLLDLVGSNRPVVGAFPAGHVSPNLVLPIGVACEIDTGAFAGLRIVEPPLIAE
jgi:muramoyltetrapeptide carboxypeptidase